MQEHAIATMDPKTPDSKPQIRKQEIASDEWFCSECEGARPPKKAPKPSAVEEKDVPFTVRVSGDVGGGKTQLTLALAVGAPNATISIDSSKFDTVFVHGRGQVG